jgi:hypothetical protein
MKLSGSRMRWVMWISLLVLLTWLVFAHEDPKAIEVVAARTLVTGAAAGQSAAQPATPSLPDGLIPRHDLISDSPRLVQRDLFSRGTWAPPPPPPVNLPVVPVAPPVPFAYLGKKHEGGTWEVYLSLADRTFVARAGQPLDPQYRVDRIDPPHLHLTYLPLGVTQTLAIGDAR